MSGRNLTNMDGSSTNVVITNRMEAQLPLEQTQATFLDPITIAMKGLNGFGGAGKVIKVNSSNNALEYATDEGSNWTLNGSSLYPLATSTNVLIGSTTNTNNKKFFVNGTSEFNNDVVINNGSAESRLLIGTNSFTENGSLVVYNPSGAGLVIFSPTQGQGNRISLRGVSNTGSDEARITFDPETGLLNETYLRFQYADKYFFDKQIIIDTTGAELSNGTNTYTLPSSTGTLALTSDISAGYWELPVVGSNALVPTDDDYFIQLQKQTDSTFETLLEFYNINQFTDYQYFRFSMNDPGTNARLKFDSERNSTITNVYEIYDSGYMAFNKGIEIKDTSFQFTAPNGDNFSFPTSTPKSGILATRGDTISALNGGTGLTSLTASKFLQVNSSGNGYDLVDAPGGSNWTLTNNNLYPTNFSTTTVSINTSGAQSGYVLNIQGSQYINGIIRLGGDLQTFNGTNGITYASGNIQKVVSNSVAYTYSFPSSSGTFALTTDIPTNNWTVSGSNIYPTGAVNVLMGITSNPNARKLYVNGDAEFVNECFCNTSLEVGSSTSSSGVITLRKSGGVSATIELDSNSRLRIGNNSVSDVSIYTNGNNFMVSNSLASNNNLVNISGLLADFKSTQTRVVELKTSNIIAQNNTSNTIVSSTYGWEFRGTSTRYNISFPGNGTYYPFFGAEASYPYFIHINNIGDAYQISGTSTGTLTHKLLGQTIIDGTSTNPALKIQTGSTIYGQIGRTSTFPSSNMGDGWNGQSVPIGNAFYIGGANTNDAEGFNLAMNGNTMMISNPGDNNALNWYDEDGRGLGWVISAAGSLVPGSDRRIKSEITTYKNSNFEKYKQIRTITYKKKIPDNINPKRLEKQSCINKYNNIYFGIVAQEIYALYPELEETESIRQRKEYYYRKDNWDNEVYEKEHKEWEVAKEKFECENQGEGKECCYNQKEPQKIFDEEEPMRSFGYDKLSILSIGVVQDLITENETLKEEVNTLRTELDTYKSIIDTLINSKSFADFKKNIA